MMRVVSTLARAGVALLVGLLVLAVLRWPPVWARPLVDVRALSLAGPAVILAVVAALTGRARARRPVRPLLIGLGAALVALAVLVALRPPAGLAATVSDPRGPIGASPVGAIDAAGPDLRHLPSAASTCARRVRASTVGGRADAARLPSPSTAASC